MASNNIQVAYRFAEQAIQLARELGEPDSEAIAQRILGQCLISLGRFMEASKILKISTSILADYDPY